VARLNPASLPLAASSAESPDRGQSSSRGPELSDSRTSTQMSSSAHLQDRARTLSGRSDSHKTSTRCKRSDSGNDNSWFSNSANDTTSLQGYCGSLHSTICIPASHDTKPAGTSPVVSSAVTSPRSGPRAAPAQRASLRTARCLSV